MHTRIRVKQKSERQREREREEKDRGGEYTCVGEVYWYHIYPAFAGCFAHVLRLDNVVLDWELSLTCDADDLNVLKDVEAHERPSAFCLGPENASVAAADPSVAVLKPYTDVE